MKRLNILIIEESDGGHIVTDLSRVWNGKITIPLMDADLAIRIEKGRVEVIKNRWGERELTELVEDIASAYSEGKI